MPGNGEPNGAPAGLGVGATAGVAVAAALGATLAPTGDGEGARARAEGDGPSARAAGDGPTLGVTCVHAPTARTSPPKASPHRRRVDLVAWAAMPRWRLASTRSVVDRSTRPFMCISRSGSCLRSCGSRPGAGRRNGRPRRWEYATHPRSIRRSRDSTRSVGTTPSQGLPPVSVAGGLRGRGLRAILLREIAFVGDAAAAAATPGAWRRRYRHRHE